MFCIRVYLRIARKEQVQIKTVVLNIELHCQRSTDEVSNAVFNTKGVRYAEVDRKKEMVTVTAKGTMDVQVLVGNLTERLRKKVVVVSVTTENEEEQGNGNENEGAASEGKKHEQQQLGLHCQDYIKRIWKIMLKLATRKTKKNPDENGKEHWADTSLMLKAELPFLDSIWKIVHKAKGVCNVAVDIDKENEMTTVTVKGTINVKVFVGTFPERFRKKVVVVTTNNEKEVRGQENENTGAGEAEGWRV